MCGATTIALVARSFLSKRALSAVRRAVCDRLFNIPATTRDTFLESTLLLAFRRLTTGYLLSRRPRRKRLGRFCLNWISDRRMSSASEQSVRYETTSGKSRAPAAFAAALASSILTLHWKTINYRNCH